MEKRKFGRLKTDSGAHALLYAPSVNKEVSIADVSAGGMKVSLTKPLAVGSSVYGQFKVLPQVGPFYIHGEVVRVDRKDKSFETAIVFKNVSTLQLSSELVQDIRDILHQ
jgi:hypothetical protein